MKWPNTLTVVRHGESDYNALKELKNQDPLYKEFKSAYNRRKKHPEEARRLAEELIADGRFLLGVGEHDTAMNARGREQAEATGRKLGQLIELPDIVLVSPYDRTHDTLDYIARGWPELKNVKQVEDRRLREQEHGLSGLYNDWRIFNIMHPEQDMLRQAQGPYYYRYPQGENVPDVQDRIQSLTTTISREYREEEVMLVTHHLSILALRANLERLNADEFHELDEREKPINCGVTIYRGDPAQGKNGKLLLDVYNQQLY